MVVWVEIWACSSAWLEHTPDKREVGSSSLPRPTKVWGRSSAGRAPALQAGGHRFEPVRLHQYFRLMARCAISYSVGGMLHKCFALLYCE